MRKLSLLCLYLILVCLVIFCNVNVHAAVPEQMKGVWLWGSTVHEMGNNGVYRGQQFK